MLTSESNVTTPLPVDFQSVAPVPPVVVTQEELRERVRLDRALRKDHSSESDAGGKPGRSVTVGILAVATWIAASGAIAGAALVIFRALLTWKP